MSKPTFLFKDKYIKYMITCDGHSIFYEDSGVLCGFAYDSSYICDLNYADEKNIIENKNIIKIVCSKYMLLIYFENNKLCIYFIFDNIVAN